MPKPIARTIKPYWTTSDGQTVKLYQGNVESVLSGLPAGSVHCVVTSPPYWGLRDYGTDKTQEIGSEKTPQLYVDRMVQVFREVRRVLRDDGVCWLNLGDTYGGGGNILGDDFVSGHKKLQQQQAYDRMEGNPSGLKSGNLVGIPWRVALALQEDGWILRQDIVWAKPSPMPESVKNRCTKAHEYIFLLVKRMGYFYDAEAIKTDSISPKLWEGEQFKCGDLTRHHGTTTYQALPEGKTNKRSVWTVSSQGYDGAHFATFPMKLIEPCIKAGTSEKGCCAECGAPWKRVVEDQDKRHWSEKRVDGVKLNRASVGLRGDGRNDFSGSFENKLKTVGWEPTCQCDADVEPCVVLDPFIGSGTTCCVAIAHGRRSIGIDLSEKYLMDNAIPRIEGELLKRPLTSHLIRREVQRLNIGRKIST